MSRILGTRGASAMRDARGFCRAFFDCYNRHHRHSGIAMMTPRDVDNCRANEIVANYTTVLALAHQRQPGPAWLNPPTNTPPLAAAAQ